MRGWDCGLEQAPVRKIQFSNDLGTDTFNCTSHIHLKNSVLLPPLGEKGTFIYLFIYFFNSSSLYNCTDARKSHTQVKAHTKVQDKILKILKSDQV